MLGKVDVKSGTCERGRKDQRSLTCKHGAVPSLSRGGEMHIRWEPALGAGHFVGLTPDRLRDEIAWTGVEIDPLTSGIAQAFYPGVDIRSAGFQTVNWPDGFLDLAISNVPFGSHSVRDTRYRRPMSIHDYFFVKSLDKYSTPS